ncbi:AAA-domain-containing protein [Tuber magnatum]|uniref:AAA-domain-containing protein n=1 Tax=Tuber magnatum TaxID=42249 RepID=A0A317SJY5_9PEZI|nr:AAA-domain-containing protein [Tuber magnatum]
MAGNRQSLIKELERMVLAIDEEGEGEGDSVDSGGGKSKGLNGDGFMESKLPRDVLPHGPPGCGKTVLASAVAAEVRVPFIAISAPSLVLGISRGSEQKLWEMFAEAREKAPCSIFIDKIDAVTPNRDNTQEEMEIGMVAQMSTCREGLTLEKTGGKPVMIIGATNRPDSLDPALRKAGRFDREICLKVPDEVGKEKILRVLCEKLRLSGDFDFKHVTKTTPRFVGADLNALVVEAIAGAMRRIYGTLETPLATTNPLGRTWAWIKSTALYQLQYPYSLLQSHGLGPQIRLLTAYPGRLTEEQLGSLYITPADFPAALPEIQPSSKREDFAMVPDVSWADIGALESLRVERQGAVVLPIKRPELSARMGIIGPTGVLLWGPPGGGKTLLAKAILNECGANSISILGSELLSKDVGESERTVRQVFSWTRESIPCVIFFDELDVPAPRRNADPSESTFHVLDALAAELDGLSDRKGIYVIVATNRPDVIDLAILGLGRLDKLLFVSPPSAEEKVEILETITKKRPLSNVDLMKCEGRHGEMKQ